MEMQFEEFYRKYYSRMRRYCFQTFHRTMLREEHLDDYDIDDIVSDAFAALAAAWDGMTTHTEAGLLCWIRKTVRNLTYSFHRKQASTPPTIELSLWLAAESEDPAMLTADPTQSAMQMAANSEEDIYQAYLSEIRKKLTGPQRSLFECIVIEKKSIPEAAKLLGMKKNTVKVSLCRLRQKLKKEILPKILNTGSKQTTEKGGSQFL